MKLTEEQVREEIKGANWLVIAIIAVGVGLTLLDMLITYFSK